jgi:hypothetical protein
VDCWNDKFFLCEKQETYGLDSGNFDITYLYNFWLLT